MCEWAGLPHACLQQCYLFHILANGSPLSLASVTLLCLCRHSSQHSPVVTIPSAEERRRRRKRMWKWEGSGEDKKLRNKYMKLWWYSWYNVGFQFPLMITEHTWLVRLGFAPYWTRAFTVGVLPSFEAMCSGVLSSWGRDEKERENES